MTQLADFAECLGIRTVVMVVLVSIDIDIDIDASIDVLSRMVMSR